MELRLDQFSPVNLLSVLTDEADATPGFVLGLRRSIIPFLLTHAAQIKQNATFTNLRQVSHHVVPFVLDLDQSTSLPDAHLVLENEKHECLFDLILVQYVFDKLDADQPLA